MDCEFCNESDEVKLVTLTGFPSILSIFMNQIKESAYLCISCHDDLENIYLINYISTN